MLCPLSFPDCSCRFPQPPQDSFNRRIDYPPQQPRHQQQGQGQGPQGFSRQPGYDQGQGQGHGQAFQRKPSFGQDQGVSGRPGGGPDFLQRQRYPQEGGAGPGAPPARRRRQFSVRSLPLLLFCAWQRHVCMYVVCLTTCMFVLNVHVTSPLIRRTLPCDLPSHVPSLS